MAFHQSGQFINKGKIHGTLMLVILKLTSEIYGRVI